MGELVGEVFWAADSGSSTTRAVLDARNRLTQALVGLNDQLPQCVQVRDMHHPDVVRNAASLARNEVETALQRIYEGQG